MHRLLVAALATAPVLLATGCMTPIPFNTVSYVGEPTVTSDRSLAMSVLTHQTTGKPGFIPLPLGGTVVPIATGPQDGLEFTPSNQVEFAALLRDELLRLRVFGSATSTSNAQADRTMQVVFLVATYRPRHNVYTLTVEVKIDGGRQPFARYYMIQSDDGDTTEQRWTTNSPEGKVKAVRKLLQKIVPDVQEYVRGDA